MGGVRTDEPCVERPKQLFEARVNRVDLRARHRTLRKARLIRYDAELYTGRSRSRDCLPCAVDKHDCVRIAISRIVRYERAVAIEENRANHACVSLNARGSRA